MTDAILGPQSISAAIRGISQSLRQQDILGNDTFTGAPQGTTARTPRSSPCSPSPQRSSCSPGNPQLRWARSPVRQTCGIQVTG